MRKALIVTVAVFVLALAGTGVASATSFTLNQSSCCGSGPFGTVNVTQSGTNTVDVLVTLNSLVYFVDTGNGTNHPDFAFNLTGAPDLTGHVTLVHGGNLHSGVAATWSFTESGGSMSDSYGTYEFAYNCSNCGGGSSNPAMGPLEFQITHTGITPAWFVANSAGTIFAADVISGYPTGPTGLVRATTDPPDPPAVPEPASMLLLGSGLLAVGYRLKRKL